MMKDLLGALGITGDPNETLRLVTLALARSMPALFLNPFLGGQSVPAQVKIGLAFSFTILMLPALTRGAPPMPVGTTFTFLMMKELAIGVTLGYLSSLVFWTFATAGRLIDTQRGANQAETMVYQLKERTSFLGQFYFQASVAIFLLLNGHHLYLRGYFESFQVLPVWQFPQFAVDPARIVEDVIEVTGRLFLVSLQLAGPAVLALFLVDVAFGVLNRAAAQINVFSLSQPVKLFVGLIIAIATLGAMGDAIELQLAAMIEDTRRFVGYLGR